MNLENIEEVLSENFPHADTQVIRAMLSALVTHNAKNNDYNGKNNLYSATGEVGRFCDLWRKVIRLYVFYFQKDTKQILPETKLENAEDALVYCAMLVAMIQNKVEALPKFTRKEIE